MSYRPLLLALFALTLNASIIGTSKPADSISADRIAQLPAADRAAWTTYLDRSQRQTQADRAALAAERTPMRPPPNFPKKAAPPATSL